MSATDSAKYCSQLRTTRPSRARPLAGGRRMKHPSGAHEDAHAFAAGGP